VVVQPGPAQRFIFSIKNHPSMKPGEIAFAMPQRKWAALSLDQEVAVTRHKFDTSHFIGSITLTVDYASKKASVDFAPLFYEGKNPKFPSGVCEMIINFVCL
jgi:hypothetical protein